MEAGSCTGTFADRSAGVIYSPRWPGAYHNKAVCGWTIHIPSEYLEKKDKSNIDVVFKFSYFNIEKTNDTIKFYTYANDTDTSPEIVAQYDGSISTPADVIVHVKDIVAVHIVFTSDDKVKRDGFILHYNSK